MMHSVGAYSSTAPETKSQRKLRCDLVSLDARNILWFFTVVVCICSVFYAYEHHLRVKRFEDKIASAYVALERHSHAMVRRVKRDVVEVYEKGRNKSEQGATRAPPIMLNTGGVTYIRWGRHDCPEKTLTNMVYSGYAAGSHYSHSGSGSNYICIDKNVSYTVGKYVEGSQGGSYIYGVEFRDAGWIHNLLDLSDTETEALQFHSLPCAVCISEIRVVQMMFPGRDVCPDGWDKQYSGYVMAGGHSDTHTSKFICVDERPHVVPGTNANDKGSFLFMVETQCASLLCEPFVANRELRCVVCAI